MLLWLFQTLQAAYPDELGFLRVFQYLTFRAVLAAMTRLPTQPVWQSAKTRGFLELGIRTATPWLPSSIEERLRVPPNPGKSSGVDHNGASQVQGAPACVV